MRIYNRVIVVLGQTDPIFLEADDSLEAAIMALLDTGVSFYNIQVYDMKAVPLRIANVEIAD